jgi:hypothetical protein
LDEAYYICGILNAPITYNYMMNSTDSRSFPIRPRMYIPKYDKEDKLHKKISQLSKKAHEVYDEEEKLESIKAEINDLYLELISKK